MHCSQSRGVTVAQVILVHFVEVRILTGLPFFLLFLPLLRFVTETHISFELKKHLCPHRRRWTLWTAWTAEIRRPFFE